MKKISTSYFLMVILLTIASDSLRAAEFCVYNNIGLQIALDTASSNNQADHIMIKKGEYIYPVDNQGFEYVAANNEFHDLTISGGWVGISLTACSLQSREIYSTTIDGNFQSRGLMLETVDGASIKITDLNFINSSVASGNEGGGLFLDTTNGAVITATIERNTFSNNFASVGGAFSQNGGTRIDFRNNLVVNNLSENGAAVNIKSINQRGIYAINNTIMNNSIDATGSFESSGLYVFVGGSSEAFIANNILWGNQLNDLWFIGYTHLKHNDIGTQNGIAEVDVGNISVIPDFLGGSNPYLPKDNSALQNAGHHLPTFIHVPPWFEEDWNHGTKDVSGRYDRIYDGLIDIGAFETHLDFPIFENGFECLDNEARGGFDCIGS